MKGFSTLPESDLVEEVRILAAKSTHGTGVAAVAARGAGAVEIKDAAAVAAGGPGGAYRRARGGGGVASMGRREEPRTFRGQCYRCDGPDMVRDCKEPRPPIVCFRCNKEGHISTYCQQGNGKGETAAPAVMPRTE